MCHNTLHTYGLRQPSMLLAAIFMSVVHAQGALGGEKINTLVDSKKALEQQSLYRKAQRAHSERSWGRSDAGAPCSCSLAADL